MNCNICFFRRQSIDMRYNVYDPPKQEMLGGAKCLLSVDESYYNKYRRRCMYIFSRQVHPRVLHATLEKLLIQKFLSDSLLVYMISLHIIPFVKHSFNGNLLIIPYLSMTMTGCLKCLQAILSGIMDYLIQQDFHIRNTIAKCF